MKKTPGKPLRLSIETVRKLDGVTLAGVVGGVIPTNNCRDVGPVSDRKCIIEGEGA